MRQRVSALVVIAASVVLAACGSSNNSSSSSSTAASGSSTTAASGSTIQSNSANKGKSVIIGSKNFTEEFILGQIYAQALKAAGYTVKTQLNLGSEQIAYRAVKSGQVDAYPEYTGTALTSFFKKKATDVPHDEQAAYQEAKTEFAKAKLTALPPTPFTDSNGVGMAKANAAKLGITKISDLKAKAPSLTFYGTPECPQRPDCLLGLKQVYGLKFKKVVAVDPSLRHKVLDSGQADVSIVYTTDGQIAQGKETLLQDDKHMFPPYNVTLVFRDATLAKLGPDAQKTIELVQKGLTTQAMQELNSRVDIDKQTPAKVAKDYLTESGYLK
ncbi:MAG: osmoprotectant transport system substrate-binding protein opuBD [Thermoleophilaceae bacterium]|jgi:glycine betaine/choline ABC-type transport system substrate-binding protein|nr:osmoprotectant transport system substrate-binding protein opuBD [Thermoleophilaceae bacterium]